MNTCKRLSESFSDYVENAMLPEQQRAVEAHLALCGDCHAEVARLQNLRSTLRQMTKLQAPPDFEALLRARLRREGRRATAQHRPKFASRFAVFAMAGMLAFFAVNFWLRQNSSLTTGAVQSTFYRPLDRSISASIPLTASILYTLDKFSPKNWPMPPHRKGEHGSALSDSSWVNPEDLPHGPQNNRASLSSL